MFRDEMDFTCMHKPRVLCRTRVQEGSDNEEEEREEEEENTDYLTDSNKENETDEENNVSVRSGRSAGSVAALSSELTLLFVLVRRSLSAAGDSNTWRVPRTRTSSRRWTK